ncbi:MAG: peroxiredoxin [Gammaproteobacteria bacterium]
MSPPVPTVIFKTRVRDESVGGDSPYVWKDLGSDEIFRNLRVVVFALPGAFTPTCSSTHLPGYEARYGQLRDAGVDEVYCLSVNDAFSMFQWARQLKVNNVKMLPDGNAEFTRGMGMLVKKENLGFGERSWRYSMLVEDGEIVKLFTEAGKVDNCDTDPMECSDAGTMLDFLKTRNATKNSESGALAA